MTTDIHEQLTKYLTDAHSIEEQALAQLRVAPDIAGDPELAVAFREHLVETEGHEHKIRDLLQERDAKPSPLKDAIMAAGGKGFLLFARLQPDTPGKLLAHALSYEGLEAASYELLKRAAERAGEDEVAGAAQQILEEERTMMSRLDEGYDRAVDASLADVAPDDLDEQLRKYLADAHAIEEQALQLLERAPKISGDSSLGRIYRDHLAETREHEELFRGRLGELGGDTSAIKDAALRLGALNWGTFFQGHPDTPGKLAAFAYAFEHLEIGGYEQLKRVAARAGDEETVRIVERVIVQEREAAERIAGAFDEAVDASLEAQGIATA